MTDRINAITLVLEKDTRVDDAENIMLAVRMLKGVVSAEGNVTDINDYVAQSRARYEIGQKVIKAVYPDD